MRLLSFCLTIALTLVAAPAHAVTGTIVEHANDPGYAPAIKVSCVKGGGTSFVKLREGQSSRDKCGGKGRADFLYVPEGRGVVCVSNGFAKTYWPGLYKLPPTPALLKCTVRHE